MYQIIHDTKANHKPRHQHAIVHILRRHRPERRPEAKEDNHHHVHHSRDIGRDTQRAGDAEGAPGQVDDDVRASYSFPVAAVILIDDLRLARVGLVGRGGQGDGAVEAADQEQGGGDQVGAVEAADGQAYDLVEGGHGADVYE